jgi:hypothetical protein
MTASIAIAPAAVRHLPSLTVSRADLRWVRPVVKLTSVDAPASLSTCCSHAPDREDDDEDCGCRDADVELTFTVESIIRGGPSRTVTLSGQCTLAPDERGGAPKFGAKDWSWEQELVEAVEALIGDDFSALDDVESAIEAAVTVTR